MSVEHTSDAASHRKLIVVPATTAATTLNEEEAIELVEKNNEIEEPSKLSQELLDPIEADPVTTDIVPIKK